MFLGIDSSVEQDQTVSNGDACSVSVILIPSTNIEDLT